MDDFAKEHGLTLNQTKEFVANQRLKDSENEARRLIDNINTEHGTKIDYEKDVDPQLEKMVNSLSKEEIKTANIYSLTERWLAKNGIGLGKKLSLVETRKLNEQKKQAAMETSSPTGAPKVDDSKSSPADILKDEMSKQGAGSFV